MRNGELVAGSNAHYDDAGYYTAAYAERTADVDYYVALAEKYGGPILEYGCGNGRIALPIARLGIDITGVDRSDTMLADFRASLKQEAREVRKRVSIKRGDMRKLTLRRKFPLVLCTFNTFLHLYTRDDVERFCARVRRHMTPRGRFVVDVCMPDPEELHRDPSRIYRQPRFKHSSGQVVRYGERFDYDRLRQVLFVSMEFEPTGRPLEGWVTPLAHRQFFPQELEALLHYNGLEVVDVHGDFSNTKPTSATDEIALHCKLRSGFR
jgi:SAM-dependent methyltransferase